jgi:hypothetical protein
MDTDECSIEYEQGWDSLSTSSDMTKSVVLSNMERGKLRNISSMIRQNDDTQDEIVRAIAEQGSSKQASIFFQWYLAVVQGLASTLVSLIFLFLIFPVTFLGSITCAEIDPNCWAFPVLNFLIFTGSLTLQGLTLIFFVLSSPLGLMAIVLDTIVSVVSPSATDGIASKRSDTNISNSSFPILTQVKDSFVELECQLELTQCQIKNTYLKLKSMMTEKKMEAEATP